MTTGGPGRDTETYPAAPLVDDHPSHVRAIAVEVAAGEPHTEYLLGAYLAIAGELMASVPVEAAAA